MNPIIERNRLLDHINALQIDKSLTDYCSSEILNAFASYNTSPEQCVAKLMNAARSLTQIQRMPIVSTIQRLIDSPSYNQIRVTDHYVDVAIICALKEPEFESVRELLEDIEITETEYTGNMNRQKFTLGVVRDEYHSRTYRVLLAYQNAPGMVDCAILSSRIIVEWRPRVLMMTGICGGNPNSDADLCDLVIAKDVFTYRTGKLGDTGFEPEPFYVQMNIDMQNAIEHSKERIIDAIMRDKKFTGNNRPRASIGTMACGDIVLDRDGAFLRMISRANRKTLAVDMESFSIYRAAQLFGNSECLPLVVKSIMDFTNDKSDSYKSIAASLSAKFAITLLQLGCLEEILSETHNKSKGKK